MSERYQYLENRYKVFKQCGINPHDTRYNLHHVLQKEDVRRGLTPPDFDVNARSNLVPLKIEQHERLNQIINSCDFMRNDITNRVHLANLAFIEEL